MVVTAQVVLLAVQVVAVVQLLLSLLLVVLELLVKVLLVVISQDLYKLVAAVAELQVLVLVTQGLLQVPEARLFLIQLQDLL